MLDCSPSRRRTTPRMMKRFQDVLQRSITLQHLDIDVGEAGDEVGVVVRACGDSEWMYDVALSFGTD